MNLSTLPSPKLWTFNVFSTAAWLSLFCSQPLLIADPLSAPRVHRANLQYQGAFRVPQGNFGLSHFGYGGQAIAHNPVRDSLFVTGHTWNSQYVAEISIPSPSTSSDLFSLPIANVLQPFADVTDGILSAVEPDTLGGMLVHNNELIWTAYEYYDADASVFQSHGNSSLNLAIPNDADGLFPVGTLNAGTVAGYMSAVPPEWQSAIGTTHVTGQAAIPIITRTSDGPALFGFNTSDLGNGVAPTETLVHYPYPHSLRPLETQNEVYNRADEISGVAFLPDTRSVLFFGTHGMGEYCYGTGEDCNDPVRNSSGTHAYPYRYQVWAYDVLDLLAVKNGDMDSWAVEPYEVWELDLPFATDSRQLGAVTFDPLTNKLYVPQLGVSSHPGNGDVYPVVHVIAIGSTSVTVDFNTDGIVDARDVDALVAEIFRETNAADLDLNGDGRVDVLDLTEWRSMAGALNLPSGNPYLLGDANLDGVVDGQDFVAWNTHKFQPTAAWTRGDFNADGRSDGEDFLLWNESKFTASDADRREVVPEPTPSLLVIWLLSHFVIRASKERRRPRRAPRTHDSEKQNPTWHAK